MQPLNPTNDRLDRVAAKLDELIAEIIKIDERAQTLIKEIKIDEYALSKEKKRK